MCVWVSKPACERSTTPKSPIIRKSILSLLLYNILTLVMHDIVFIQLCGELIYKEITMYSWKRSCGMAWRRGEASELSRWHSQIHIPGLSSGLELKSGHLDMHFSYCEPLQFNFSLPLKRLHLNLLNLGHVFFWAKSTQISGYTFWTNNYKWSALFKTTCMSVWIVYIRSNAAQNHQYHVTW